MWCSSMSNDPAKLAAVQTITTMRRITACELFTGHRNAVQPRTAAETRIQPGRGRIKRIHGIAVSLHGIH